MFRLSPYCPERPIRTASLRSHHSGLSRIRADAVAFPIFSHVPDTNFSAAGEGLMEWRKEVVDFALDHETRLQVDEQLAWLKQEPRNPRPYFHLAQLYRMQWKQ